jgi:hypothetical protein
MTAVQRRLIVFGIGAAAIAAGALTWSRSRRQDGRIEMPVGPSPAIIWDDGGPPKPRPYVVPLVPADAR